MSTRVVSRLFVLATVSLAACGGGGGGGKPGVSKTLSSVVVAVPFGTPSDGVTDVDVTVTVIDTKGKPVTSQIVELRASGAGNVFVQPAVTDANGVATGSIASLVAERKGLVAAVRPGPKEVILGPVSVEFVRLLPNTFFVRTSGSDANPGDAPLQAWRTLGHALTQVGAGDTLYVGAGTYDPLVITKAANAQKPLRLRADVLGLYTGDAGDVVLDAGGTAFALRFAGAAFVQVRGFTLRGALPTGGPGAGVWLDAPQSTSCSVEEASIRENVVGVAVGAAQGFSLEACRVSANLAQGIGIGPSSGVSLLDDRVYANGAEGLLLDGPSTNLSVAMCTFFRNGQDQITETMGGNTGTIRDNVVSEGPQDGIELHAGSSLVLASNLAWSHAGLDYDTGGGLLPPTNHVGDPLFVDPDGADSILGGTGDADDDFHVGALSLSLDNGDQDARDLSLGVHGAAAASATRADHEYDGQGTDGALANLGSHTPVALDVPDALPLSGGRASYALADDVVVRSRTWDRATNAWASAKDALAANRDVRWVVQRVAPTLQTDELVALLVDTGTQGQLYVRHWDGRKWSETSEGPLTTAIPTSDERGFDVEFESSSGEALVAWATGGGIPSFRRFANGVWSDPAPCYANPVGAGDIRWVELCAAAQGDRLALVTLDTEADLVACLWDGNAWGPPELLETDVISVDDYKPFDAAFESLSGDLLVLWGYSTFTEQARFGTYGAVSGVWTFGLHASSEAVGSQILLEPDPTSDRIVAAFGEAPTDDDIVASVWDGSIWVHTRELTLLGAPDQVSIDVGWVGTTGLAFAIWRNASMAGGSFELAIWNGVWKTKPEVHLPGVGQVVGLEARPVPTEGRTLFLMLDDTGDLFAVSFNGTSWTVQNAGVPLATGLDPLALTQRFSFQLRDE